MNKNGNVDIMSVSVEYNLKMLLDIYSVIKRNTNR